MALPALLEEQARHQLQTAPDADILDALRTMVDHPDYPCLGARSVFRRESADVIVLDDLGDTSDGGSLDLLGEKLQAFGTRSVDAGTSMGDLVSLIAVFREPVTRSEEQFETLLWAALRRLHRFDEQPWAPEVSADPSSAHFSFSYHQTAYFIVGLHPAASRIGRRTPLPTLVFNLHAQFEQLRSDARFTRIRETIRRRDEALNGSVNPMVDDYGDSSEARQYSGRAVPPTWLAPFPKEP
ncbi:guanitoxin biosynthesis heme-dependent pre-guanitoxin N-hydroxylase GntA [Janibacter sp. GXQ6167]|uniref:guanitoxin biosynthesis heme-dependent pre-guanitoxin N-hydroxylase GntA n=1 Tax=Janibacter sp. GXQ6167 TaxID=3240791 RepID=UPI003524F5B6